MATSPLIPTVFSIGDPDGARTVTSIVVLLVAIGLALVLLAVWIFRTTRPDPDLLAPLEAMGDRSWRRADPVWQRRRLDELRPPGAQPLAPSVAPPELDEAFDAGPTASGFEDLRSSGQAADAPDGTAADGTAPDAADSGSADATPVRGEGLDQFDDLSDDDFDPDALAAARQQLENELTESARTSRSADGQLGLFDHDHTG